MPNTTPVEQITPARPGYRALRGQILIYNAELLDDIVPQFFELSHWDANSAVVGEAPGRGTTYFVRHEGQELALRHYKRGGGLGKLVNDSYWYSGIVGTRPWREWHILAKLHNLGLPVCVPVAARLIPGRRFYKADLITQRIEGARSWQDWMFDSDLPGDYWVSLGKLLRRFHNVGLYHHDLNIRNIMRHEDGRLWLIDFDQAEIRKPGGWQRANLARMKRSIHKLEKQGKEMHFTPSHWGQLMQGYASAAI